MISFAITFALFLGCMAYSIFSIILLSDNSVGHTVSGKIGLFTFFSITIFMWTTFFYQL